MPRLHGCARAAARSTYAGAHARVWRCQGHLSGPYLSGPSDATSSISSLSPTLSAVTAPAGLSDRDLPPLNPYRDGREAGGGMSRSVDDGSVSRSGEGGREPLGDRQWGNPKASSLSSSAAALHHGGHGRDAGSGAAHGAPDETDQVLPPPPTHTRRYRYAFCARAAVADSRSAAPRCGGI
eukprot:187771-Rhodomonas_salina.2